MQVQLQPNQLATTKIQNSSFDKLCQIFQPVNGKISLAQTKDKIRTIVANHLIERNSQILRIQSSYLIRPSMQNQHSILSQYIYSIKSLEQEGIQELHITQQWQTLFPSGQDNQIIPIQSLVYLIEKKYMKKQLHPIQKIDSAHEFYLDLLELNHKNHPINFASLISKYHINIGYQLQKRKKEIQKIYQALISILDPFSYFKIHVEHFYNQQTYQQYIQAFTIENIIWAILNYRTFFLEEGNIIPMLSLFKHSSNPNAFSIFDYQQNAVIVRAARDIHPQQEIFILYQYNLTIQNIFSLYGYYCEGQNCQIISKVRVSLREIPFYISNKLLEYEYQFADLMKKQLFQIFGSRSSFYYIQYFRGLYYELFNKKLFEDILQNTLAEGQIDEDEARILNALKMVISKELGLLEYVMSFKGQIFAIIKRLKRQKKRLT